MIALREFTIWYSWCHASDAKHWHADYRRPDIATLFQHREWRPIAFLCWHIAAAIRAFYFSNRRQPWLVYATFMRCWGGDMRGGFLPLMLALIGAAFSPRDFATMISTAPQYANFTIRLLAPFAHALSAFCLMPYSIPNAHLRDIC